MKIFILFVNYTNNKIIFNNNLHNITHNNLQNAVYLHNTEN